ncbi:MAG TPA: alpha/beta fold hydrolase [Actinocrinis sp.]|jgi:dienelactone hydrolase
MVASLIVLALAAGGAAGCSSGSGGSGAAVGDASASASASDAISATCITPGSAQAKQIVHYASPDGVQVEAYMSSPPAGKQVSSSGTVGMVIVHQSQQTLCESLSSAVLFSRAGYLVLAPTVGEYQQVADVEASVTYLRAHGAKQVVLLGASMGGTAVLQAAASVKPPVQAVVSLSGPSIYSPMDALLTAPTLAVPVFYSAGAQDTEFATDETDLYNATTEKDKTLDIVPNDSSHGFALLGDLLSQVEAFLQAHIS